MDGFARVRSVDAPAKLAAAMTRFGEEATVALDTLGMEVRRALEWIHHDRPEFWRQRVRRGWDEVSEARQGLERCLTFHRIGDYRPACQEEKVAVERAKQRLRVAEEKVQTVRHWSHAIEHEVNEYRACLNRLAAWLQRDLPVALATLQRMSGALESYVGLHSAADQETAATNLRSVPGPPEPEIRNPKSEIQDPKSETAPGSPSDATLGPAQQCRPPGAGDGDAPDRQP